MPSNLDQNVSTCDQFSEIAQEMIDLYAKKNSDYGNSFHNTFYEFGIISAVVRIADKYNRLSNLSMQNSFLVDETIEDTLKDLASYCIMTIMEIRKFSIMPGMEINKPKAKTSNNENDI